MTETQISHISLLKEILLSSYRHLKNAIGDPVAKDEFEGIFSVFSLPSRLVLSVARGFSVSVPTTSLCVTCRDTFHFKISVLVTMAKAAFKRKHLNGELLTISEG